ncbi:MAG: MFS transporter, partial [Chloroflexi bacterium]|nr:MFS transporter [Chloroflexota bacterium]
SWHWVFFLNVPLGVLIIALFVFFFPNVRPDNLKHRIDYAGAVTLVLTVVPLMLALSWGGVEYPWSSPPIIGMFAFAALMGILFIFIERHSQEPLIPLWLFRNRVVGVAEVVIFLAGFGMFGAIIFVPLFFQGVFGVSAAASGKFLTPMMLGMVTGSFFSGQLLSRAGGHYRLLGAVGIALMVLGMGLLSRMTAGTGYLVAIASIVATGFGLGITMPLYTIAVQNAVPYSVLGVATASVPFFRSIGGSVGLALFGAVMNNRFAAELLAGAPSAFNGTISTDWLSALARNPQALFSPEAQASLKVLLEQLGPQASALFPQLLDGLRHSLNSALSQVFLFGMIIMLVALAVHLFIREIPLRKQHSNSRHDHQT